MVGKCHQSSSPCNGRGVGAIGGSALEDTLVLSLSFMECLSAFFFGFCYEYIDLRSEVPQYRSIINSTPCKGPIVVISIKSQRRIIRHQQRNNRVNEFYREKRRNISRNPRYFTILILMGAPKSNIQRLRVRRKLLG